MNERKLKQLFGAARKDPAPPAPEGFDQAVLQATRRDRTRPPAPAVSLFDQLNLLFPRLAWATGVVVLLCVAGELVSSVTGPSLTEEVAQLSEQWLFAPDEF